MKLWQLLKEVLLSIFDRLFYFISSFFEKNRSIWIFGSMFGGKYADNSKYLFEHLSSHHPEVRAVWFSGNSEVVASLRMQGLEAYRFYDPKGVLLAVRAGVGVVSHSVVRDIRPFVLSREVVLVNLWHGIPLKKIALDDNVSSVRNKTYFMLLEWVAKLLCPGLCRRPDLLIAASAEDQQNFSSAFDIPLEKIKITGYPRNDEIFSDGLGELVVFSGRTGIYMPTFRGKENSYFDFFEQFGFDVEVVDRLLSEIDTRLYLKLHHFNWPPKDLRQRIFSTKNIFLYDQADVYTDLSSFDFLITDFSSIYFDFLLLERPIIFAPFDKDGFMKSARQLYYDYEEVTPGLKARDWPEVMECVAKVVQNPDEYLNRLKEMKKRFHLFADAGSSERVYKAVRMLL